MRFALSQENLLENASAEHSQAAESPTISHALSIVVQESNHAHTAASPELSQHSTLSVASATHDQTSDAANLVLGFALAVDDSFHHQDAEVPNAIHGLPARGAGGPAGPFRHQPDNGRVPGTGRGLKPPPATGRFASDSSAIWLATLCVWIARIDR